MSHGTDPPYHLPINQFMLASSFLMPLNPLYNTHPSTFRLGASMGAAAAAHRPLTRRAATRGSTTPSPKSTIRLAVCFIVVRLGSVGRCSSHSPQGEPVHQHLLQHLLIRLHRPIQDVCDATQRHCGWYWWSAEARCCCGKGSGVARQGERRCLPAQIDFSGVDCVESSCDGCRIWSTCRGAPAPSAATTAQPAATCNGSFGYVLQGSLPIPQRQQHQQQKQQQTWQQQQEQQQQQQQQQPPPVIVSLVELAPAEDAARLERRAARQREQVTYQFAAVAASLGVTATACFATYYRIAWHLHRGDDFPVAELAATLALWWVGGWLRGEGGGGD